MVVHGSALISMCQRLEFDNHSIARHAIFCLQVTCTGANNAKPENFGLVANRPRARLVLNITAKCQASNLSRNNVRSAAVNPMQNQTHNQVHYLTVAPEFEGQRIDNYLIRVLKGVPKSQIYRILRKGEVRVNKGRIKPHYRVQPGDQIRIPPLRMSDATTPQVGPKSVQALENAILYEDKRIIIINKPCGMAVHGGSGVSVGVIEAMRHWRTDLHYLELVHRLDRETSGCLILAKKRSALRQLHEQLRESDMHKRYLVVVQGAWERGEYRLEKALNKNVLRSGERMVRVSDEGKSAISIFKPVIVRSKASLMEVQILTGRTHQIRVHAAFLGHPVAGDDKYGDETFNRYVKSLGAGRMLLHARSLEFEMTEPHIEIAVNAPLDKPFEKTLEALKLAE